MREGFTSAGATQVTAAACRAAGLDDGDAELIRLGENALFRLASAPMIVRVARGEEWLPTARTEVAVSRWLADEGFPAARIIDDLDQPFLIEGHPVTFWHLIVEGDRKATYRELGGGPFPGASPEAWTPFAMRQKPAYPIAVRRRSD